MPRYIYSAPYSEAGTGMLRGRTAGLFCLLASARAQVPYTQTQAASFLTAYNDVLAAVAPSVDPTHKLAAQTSVSLPEGTPKPWTSLSNALSGQTCAIVEAQRVVAFRAVVNAPEALAEFVAGWAGVDTANVLVSTENAFAEPPVYNVTVYPQQDAADAGKYAPAADFADELIKRLPPQCENDTATVLNCICTAAALTQSATPLISLQPQGGGLTPCDNTFQGAAIAYRYRIDIFSDYDIPNANTADAVTAVFHGLTTSAGLITSTRRLPANTLQYISPVATYTPGPLSLTSTIVASLGVSGGVLAVGAVLWYRSVHTVA